MPALITCGGADIQRGRISLATRGAGWAELDLDTDTPPTGKVKIEAADGLSLAGTIVQSGVFLLTARARWVAGAGGLAVEVEGAYQRAQLRDPLADVLRAAGESQSSTIAEEVLAVSLPRFTLGRCSAATALDDLAAAATAQLGKVVTWRVLGDGSIWLGAETWPSQALPGDSVIAEVFPAEGRTVIGCASPALLPGVDLEGVGRVVGVDHYLEPDHIRSHAWLLVDVVDKIRSVVLASLGLDYDGAPRIDRLALYRAKVEARSADGKTVDVRPESARIQPVQSVPMRYAPGLVAIVDVGAVVLLGWEAGDPARIYARPDYEDGATFSKLVLAATSVILGAESGAQFVALANLVKGELQAIAAALISHTHSGVTTGTGSTGTSSSSYSASDVAAERVRAK